MLNVQNPWTGEIMECYIHEDKYVEGDGLALILLDRDLEYGYLEPYCDITVNLPGEMLTGENCAFVDVNNAPFIRAVLEENGLAEFTGMMGFSGWCAYPEYRFNMDEVRKHLVKEDS